MWKAPAHGLGNIRIHLSQLANYGCKATSFLTLTAHQDGLWDPRKPCVLGGFCQASCHSKPRSIHDSTSSRRFLLSLPPCALSFLEGSFYSDHNLDVAISKVPSSTHCLSEHFLRAVVAGILFIFMVISTTHMPSKVHLWIFLLELQICTPHCL